MYDLKPLYYTSHMLSHIFFISVASKALNFIKKFLTCVSRVMGPALSTSKISPFLVPTRIFPWPRTIALIAGEAVINIPREPAARFSCLTAYVFKHLSNWSSHRPITPSLPPVTNPWNSKEHSNTHANMMQDLTGQHQQIATVYPAIYTAELQWLWNHENMFETRVVRASEC